MSTSSHPTFLKDLASLQEHTAPACAAVLRVIATRLERYEAAEERQAAQDRIKWATKGLDEPPFRHLAGEPASLTNAPDNRRITREYLEALQKTETEFWRHIEQYRAPGARSIVRDGGLIIEGTTPEPIRPEYIQNRGDIPIDHGHVGEPAMVEVKHAYTIWPTASELEGPPLPPFKYLTWDHVARLKIPEIRAMYGEEAADHTRTRCITGWENEPSAPSRMTES